MKAWFTCQFHPNKIHGCHSKQPNFQLFSATFDRFWQMISQPNTALPKPFSEKATSVTSFVATRTSCWWFGPRRPWRTGRGWCDGQSFERCEWRLAGVEVGMRKMEGRKAGKHRDWCFFFFRVNPASLKREVSKNVLANRDLLYLRLSHSATFSELWTEVDAAVTCVVIFGSARSEEGKWQGNYEQDKLALKQKSAKTSWQAFLKHETSYILRLENVRSAIDSIYSNFIIIVIIIIINYIIIIILPRRSDQVAR